MGIIYKYTSPNGKSYIGQTQGTLESRREDDFGKGYRGSPAFYNAILYYKGLQNFTVEVLEECENKLLDERERYYIDKFNTLTPNGYNLNLGGQGMQNASPVIKYDIEGNRLKKYDSIAQAARDNNCSTECILHVLAGRTQTGKGFRWGRLGQELKPLKKTLRKRVYQFDLNGFLIKEFESCRNADRYYNYPMGTVAQCANKNQKRRRVGEFIFTYEPDLDRRYYNLT